jgi:hypothetical protein
MVVKLMVLYLLLSSVAMAFVAACCDCSLALPIVWYCSTLNIRELLSRQNKKTFKKQENLSNGY